MDTVNYKCQNCGSPLIIEPGQVQAMCAHCRSQNLITIGSDGSITLSLVHKIDSIDNKATHLLNTQSETLLATERMREVAAAGRLLEQATKDYHYFIKNKYTPQMANLEKEKEGKTKGTEKKDGEFAGWGCWLGLLLLGMYLAFGTVRAFFFEGPHSFTELIVGFVMFIIGVGLIAAFIAAVYNDIKEAMDRSAAIQKAMDDLNKTKADHEKKITDLKATISTDGLVVVPRNPTTLSGVSAQTPTTVFDENRKTVDAVVSEGAIAVNYKCQNCGSPLIVEPGQSAAMCPHCRSQNFITVEIDGSVTLSLAQKIGSIDNKADQLLTSQNEALMQAQRLQKTVSEGHLLKATMEEYRNFVENEYKPEIMKLEKNDSITWSLQGLLTSVSGCLFLIGIITGIIGLINGTLGLLLVGVGLFVIGYFPDFYVRKIIQKKKDVWNQKKADYEKKITELKASIMAD